MMKKLNANTVAAAAATVTAVAALVVAVWENVQSREYNRLSVRPYLLVEASRNTTDSRDLGELRLMNQGVGPAVVRAISFRLADDTTAEYENWSEVASILRSRGVLITGWTDLSPGRPIGVDREILLFSFEREVVDGTVAEPTVQDLFELIQVDITYEAVYGDSFDVGWPAD
jgi:hypothetical protein